MFLSILFRIVIRAQNASQSSSCFLHQGPGDKGLVDDDGRTPSDSVSLSLSLFASEMSDSLFSGEKGFVDCFTPSDLVSLSLLLVLGISSPGASIPEEPLSPVAVSFVAEGARDFGALLKIMLL